MCAGVSGAIYSRGCPVQAPLGRGSSAVSYIQLMGEKIKIGREEIYLSSQQGRDTEELVVDAVERMVNYDRWLMREVEKGKSAADRGELVDHDDVQKLIDRRYPG